MRLIQKLRLPLIIIGVGFLVSFFLKSLKISDVECFDQFGECEKTLLDETKKVIGMSYPDAKKSLDELLKSKISVKKSSVRFQLPAKLEVNIIESKPRYAIFPDGNDYYFLIGKEGIVLSKTKTTDLPIISIKDFSTDVGAKVDEKILFGLETVYFVKKGYKYDSAYIDGEKLIIELDQGPTVIFPIEGDRDFLLGAFNLIMGELRNIRNSFKMESQGIIDLRFKNPILRSSLE